VFYGYFNSCEIFSEALVSAVFYKVVIIDFKWFSLITFEKYYFQISNENISYKHGLIFIRLAPDLWLALLNMTKVI
jgi:hypothetical protein